MPGLSKEFDLYYATQHDDPLLIEAAKRWSGNWSLTVKVVTREEMEGMLDAAYASQIKEKAWLKRIHPHQRDMLEIEG
jgi:hypothetical protein